MTPAQLEALAALDRTRATTGRELEKPSPGLLAVALAVASLFWLAVGILIGAWVW
ncbi:hypothetical protein GCM10018962_77450 [Dactylosporangium matsuzakiense]|uniref:hypothetical protein n=1 Tax=Dactylosporangium matsuzakiense TaxID=53360 RepID=UPI0031E91FF0